MIHKVEALLQSCHCKYESPIQGIYYLSDGWIFSKQSKNFPQFKLKFLTWLLSRDEKSYFMPPFFVKGDHHITNEPLRPDSFTKSQDGLWIIKANQGPKQLSKSLYEGLWNIWLDGEPDLLVQIKADAFRSSPEELLKTIQTSKAKIWISSWPDDSDWAIICNPDHPD